MVYVHPSEGCGNSLSFMVTPQQCTGVYCTEASMLNPDFYTLYRLLEYIFPHFSFVAGLKAPVRACTGFDGEDADGEG